MARFRSGEQRLPGLRSNGRFAVAVLACCTLVACAGHRSRLASASTQPPVYPPIPPDLVQILNRRPLAAYDELGTVTVQEESAKPLAHTLEEVRGVAAQAGANAAVLLNQTTFRQHNGVTGRRTNM